MKESSGAKVLVVDDDNGSRQMLRRLLVRHGYQVTLAESGEAALAAVAEGRFDIVLLDLMMPGMDGFELLCRLRTTQSVIQLPVIMLTGRGEQELVMRAFGEGANDYITKPFDFELVDARIRTQLQMRTLAALKDDMLRIASHDLKKPLMLIGDVADSLLEELQPGAVIGADQIEALTLIQRAGGYMSALIRDFLDLQAMEDGHVALACAPVDLLGLAAEVVQANRSYAEGKGIALTLKDKGERPRALGDVARLRQVLDNLVGNAIKFGPPQTRVEVRVTSGSELVRLEVCDTGPGLSAEDMTKLFQRNVRLSNRPTGGENSTGFGLAICRELVELQGGRIGAHNNDAAGSTFWLTLPVAP